MTDEDVVRDLVEVMGVGKIYTYTRRLGWKTMYVWQVHRMDEVRSVILTFLPYLGQRRSAKALELLAWLENRPGKGYHLVDGVRVANRTGA